MTPLRTRTTAVGAIAYAAISMSYTVAAQVPRDSSRDQAAEPARIAFSHASPQFDCGRLNITAVEATDRPGESSPSPSHPSTVVGHVIQGALGTRVKGEAEAVYNPGESFYEAPGGIPLVAANVSAKIPVKFLAYFVCEHDTSLNVAPPESTGAGVSEDGP
jgi:quercetin dioxygenase-like cupin family protein